MPAPFQAVIFDNDGLLLDTEEAWTRAESELFARRGRTFTMEHKRAIAVSRQLQESLSQCLESRMSRIVPSLKQF